MPEVHWQCHLVQRSIKIAAECEKLKAPWEDAYPRPKAISLADGQYHIADVLVETRAKVQTRKVAQCKQVNVVQPLIVITTKLN